MTPDVPSTPEEKSENLATKKMKAVPRSSSTPPNFPEEQADLFREVLKALNECEVPYVVSGAFAIHEHTGIWRDTKDLDLFLPAEYVPDALRILSEQGYETEVPDDVWLAKVYNAGYEVDLITGMSNGSISVDMTWIERSTPCLVLGVPARVLGPEELIASKVFVTRRERFDGADVVHVIYGTQGKLDWDYLMSLVAEKEDHWEILFWHLVLFHYVYPAQSDFVPASVWDSLVARFYQAVKNPDPTARFRGSLVDENMFSIDVEEWGLPNLNEELRREREPKIVEMESKLEPAA